MIMWEGVVERRKQVQFLSGFDNRGKGREKERKKKKKREWKRERKKIDRKKKRWWEREMARESKFAKNLEKKLDKYGKRVQPMLKVF